MVYIGVTDNGESFPSFILKLSESIQVYKKAIQTAKYQGVVLFNESQIQQIYQKHVGILLH